MGNGPTKEKKGKGSNAKGGSSSSLATTSSNNNSNNSNNTSNVTSSSNKTSSSSSITSSHPSSTSTTTSSSSISTSQPSSTAHHHESNKDKDNHHHHNHKDNHKDNHKHQGSSSESSKVEDSKGFSLKKAEELFEKYKDSTDEQQIGPDGIEQLCKDINVDPEDVLVLVLAWHLGAVRMGFFSRDEFISGLQKLGVDSVARLAGLTVQFRAELSDAVRFKDIYRFAFSFAKEKETKIIDLQTADALLALVLGDRYAHTEALRAYLQEQTTYKSVNLDQWMNILEFSRSIKADLSNYDENSAWPVLLDEYCEWAKKRLDKAPS